MTLQAFQIAFHETLNRFMENPPNCSIFASFPGVVFFRGSDMLRSFCGDPLFGRSCRVCWTKTWPWPTETPVGEVGPGERLTPVVQVCMAISTIPIMQMVWSRADWDYKRYVINSYKFYFQHFNKHADTQKICVNVCDVVGSRANWILGLETCLNCNET